MPNRTRNRPGGNPDLRAVPPLSGNALSGPGDAARHFTVRTAGMADLPDLRALMARSIAALQKDFLSDAQIEASHMVMGLDSQLVKDGTYYVLEERGMLAGCGGWSWRATLYGGDASVVAREPEPLDPARDAARIRAMYTDPAFARCGVGQRILQHCEGAAAAAGFRNMEMMATLSGEPLYRACGYTVIEHVLSAPIKGVTVPLIRMGKRLPGDAMIAEKASPS